METKVTLKQSFFLAAVLIHSFVTSAQSYNNIEFVENKGQWDPQIKFKGDVYAGAFYIRSGGFSVLQHNRQDYDYIQAKYFNHDHAPAARSADKDEKMILRSHLYAVDFIGANKNMQIIPDKAIPTYNNYFIGNDPSRWAGNCRIFQGITMKDVYPDVDVRYYTDNGMLKYDIIAKPGADISKIALKYQGADKLSVRDKELIVNTSVGELRESYPYTYQADGKERKQVSCKYIVKDNIVRFDVKGYDPAATLVIDPFLIFCSFSGSSASNWGFTATYGPDGSFYGGGIVFGNGFSVTPGAFQTSFQGGSGTDAVDIGIIKLSPNGSTRVYGTYIGGAGNEQPHSLIVDPQGNLILAGRSNSGGRSPAADYPMIGSAIGSGNTDYDIVVTKLNAAGSNLIGSKRIGGSSDDGVNISSSRSGPSSLQQNYGDDGRSEVILDGAGNIYVASSTQSSNFPGTAGFFQPGFGGGLQDGVVLKLPPDVSALTFASYLGGSANDAAYVLALSPASGEIYVAGGTASTNFPRVQPGTVGGGNFGGVIDGFVAQISNNGTTHIRSAYLGTSGIDQVFGIQFDRLGFPYVMGQTTGVWPVTPGVQTYGSATAKQFIAKLQPDLSSYIYSTVFGTNSSIPNISPTAFLVDRCENVYVSGWGGENGNSYQSAGTTGLPVTADAYKSTTDGKDFYFFVMKRDATDPNPLYASFFGQNGGPFGDHVDGGTSRFDVNGVIYQGVCANCGGGASFPVTPGVAGPVNNALPQGCNLGMIKMAFNLAGVGSEVESAIGGVPRDTAGCLPLDVTFTDQVRNATEYIWNFGDGSPQIGPLPAATGYTQTHTFTTVGTFQVMLIAIDPASCNIRDTSYINIRVGDLIANLAIDAVKQNPCDSFKYRFDNLSTTDPSRPFTNTSFIWKFEPGSTPVVAGTNSVIHSFPGPGTYTVWLVLQDTAYCNYPDSVSLQISVAENVDAGFTVNPIGCAGDTISFINTATGGQTYQWDFGDGNISTAFEPTHIYINPGSYPVVMVATNPGTCNITDTARFTIVVYSRPTADFSYTPLVPVENATHTFTNLSSTDAVLFKWFFGDGDSLVTTSRGPVQHQYNATGTFNACLYAYNAVGCFDRECKPVTTIVVPALDVPNAFTPNQPGVNSVIYVRGFGIAKMKFIIWNRWGQKVFETGNRLQGWDGRVKGVVQPMDVYAYTLDVEFFDGTKTTKTGDITLIR